MNISKRNTALDITRITAMLSVISIHFFLNSGFYDNPILSRAMLFPVILRTALTVCVPLFIMLSGYLLNRKTLSIKYYSGISKTLGIYVLTALSCMLYKNIRHGVPFTPRTIVFGILDFTGANYSWYIEMYIGLFLMIPFLNLMYHGLETKKKKGILVLTLFALTTLPSLLNIYNFETPGWFQTPSLSESYQAIVPDWWINSYPITYYMMGAYLKEYPVHLKKRYHLLLIAGAVLLFGLFNYYRCVGGYFCWGEYTDWYGICTLILSFLVFSFLTIRNTSTFPIWSKKFLAHISDLCLGAYLISYVWDDFFYGFLWKFVPEFSQKFHYFLPMVLIVAVFSLLSSWILNLIYRLIESTIQKIFSKRTKKEKELVTTAN